jgi:hypothetical protein
VTRGKRVNPCETALLSGISEFKIKRRKIKIYFSKEISYTGSNPCPLEFQLSVHDESK